MSAHRSDPVSHSFPGLDTLRAIGALAVLTTHTAFWAGDYTGNGWTGTLLARLDVGVALFFVLSGFLLSRSWFTAAAMDTEGPPSGRYAWKRFLRIAPVYLVTVVVAYLFLDDNQGRSVGQFVATALGLDVYLDSRLPAGLSQMWSLAVEVSFYALLPLFMVLLVGRRPRWQPRRVLIGLVIGCAISALWWFWGAFAVSGARPEAMPLQWLPGYLTWFAIGIGFAWLYVGGATFRAGARMSGALELVRRLAQRPGALWVLALGVLMVSATPIAGPSLVATPTPEQALVKNVLYAVIAAALVLPSVFGEPGTTYARAMANPVARHLGLISYSMFCIHLPVLHFVMWSTGWILFEGRGVEIWAMTLALSLVASELLYRVVELPAMRLRGLGRGRDSANGNTNRPNTAISTT